MENKEKVIEKAWGEEVFPFLTWFETHKVKDAKVMVVGAGALGNEVLKNLALFGVGTIVIVDFDTIEFSNLTRSILFRPQDADKGYFKADVAARRIKEINPTVRTLPVCADLNNTGLGLYRRMNVVVGCLDSLEARVALNRLCFRAGKTWVDGAIGDMEGQTSVYQHAISCYECNLTKGEKKDLSKRISCPDIVKMNEKVGRVATTPISASIIAAVQTQEAMKVIHIDDEVRFRTLAGKIFAYDGRLLSVDIFDFSEYHSDCTAHECWNPVIEAPTLSADATVSQALTIIKQAVGADKVEINMRNDRFVDRIVSRTTNQRFSPMLPASKIPDYIRSSDELNQLQTVEGFFQHAIENIDETFPYPRYTLRQIGIPYFDVVQVSTPKGLFYVELSQDANQYEEITPSH